MKFVKRALSIFFALVFCVFASISVFSLDIKKPELELNAKSALLMDANTGTVLYAYNEHDRLAPASVTKIMTLLLVFEAIDKGSLKYDDVLSVSENAASMGGSQIYLEPGETMSIEDLLKSVIIASANDAALTLAENVAGSEDAFVDMMNQRAKELGMQDTHFENVTGLDDDVKDHLTSAYDIALMSRELLKHEKVMDYTTIWMDTVRNGEFGLTNTNRLIRFYKGATGLKTGSTSKAGFCVSASAKRDGLHLIAVIMGAETSDLRNASASKLLDFGFANYAAYSQEQKDCGNVYVLGGKKDFTGTYLVPFEALVNKGNESKVTVEINIPEKISAPIKKGDRIGKATYKIGDEIIGESNVCCTENIDKIDFWSYVKRVFENFLLK